MVILKPPLSLSYQRIEDLTTSESSACKHLNASHGSYLTAARAVPQRPALLPSQELKKTFWRNITLFDYISYDVCSVYKIREIEDFKGLC